MKILVVLFILFAGCGGVAHVSSTAPPGTTFANSWTPERCQVLLDQRDAATWAAALGGGLSAAGAVGAAFPEDDKLQMGLGLSTAVLAAVTTSMTVLAKLKSDTFEMYCNTGAPLMLPPVEVRP